MTTATASWFVVIIALLGANLPFLNDRLFGFLNWSAVRRSKGDDSATKPIWLRLIELICFYFVVGAIGFALEARLGNVFPQGWQFFAVTGCLFLVLAFPGFVFRYLRRRRA